MQRIYVDNIQEKRRLRNNVPFRIVRRHGRQHIEQKAVIRCLNAGGIKLRRIWHRLQFSRNIQFPDLPAAVVFKSLA